MGDSSWMLAEIARLVRRGAEDGAWDEVLRGAHVILIDDGGHYYEQWKNRCGRNALQGALAAGRVSSHHRAMSFGHLQYEVAVELDGVAGYLLFGLARLPDVGQPCTFFQLEAHSGRSVRQVVPHLADFTRGAMQSVKGALGGKPSPGLQVGPYGTSRFTDHAPLLISVSGSKGPFPQMA